MEVGAVKRDKRVRTLYEKRMKILYVVGVEGRRLSCVVLQGARPCPAAGRLM